jgi:hypothetical protein
VPDRTIHIESPLPFTLVRTGDVTITVKVTNFNLVDKIGQATVTGEGHIDWYMDADVPTTPDVTFIPKFGAHVATATTSYTWKNVPIGTRFFTVQLVNNDHTTLESADSIILNVVPPATGPAIGGTIGAGLGEYGTPSSFYYNSATREATVSVSTRNFNITDTKGQTIPNVPDQGHFIYYMDVDPPATGGLNTVTGNAIIWMANYYIWKNVQPGVHSFSVQLVNNDDTPLSPPLVYKVVVNCQDITGPATSPSPTRTPATTATPGTASPAPSATATMSPSPTP